MSITYRFILFQVIIILPFILGIYAQKHINNIAAFSKKIINSNIIVLEPLIVLWSVWGIQPDRQLALLPLLGLMMVTIGFCIGLALRRFIADQGESQRTFIISSSLANHGFTMGGFICYIMFGEQGLAYSMVFIAYFMPFIYIVIFPYARAAHQGGMGIMAFIKKNSLTVQNMPIYAILAAMLLVLRDIKRPDIAFPIDALVMVTIALYYFTLGANFNVSKITIVRREHVILAVSKFLVIPVIMFLVVGLLNINTEIARIIVLQSFMPTAVYSVMSAVLFDLDSELASNMFVVNTIVFLVLVLPLLVFAPTGLF